MSFGKNSSHETHIMGFGTSGNASIYSSLIRSYKIMFILSISYVFFFFSSLLILIFGAVYFGFWFHYFNVGSVTVKNFSGWVTSFGKVNSSYALNGNGFLALLICGIILFLATFVFPTISSMYARRTMNSFPFILKNAEPTNIKYASPMRFLHLTTPSAVTWYMFNPMYSCVIAFRIDVALEIAYNKLRAKNK